MAWIESHTVLLRHRKLVELARELRLKPVHTMGHLHALWHAALEQREDGDLSSWSDEFIAASACYNGDAPRFVRLLQTYGWLDGKLIHDWLDYVGLFLTRKYSTSNKAGLEIIWKLHGQEYGVNAKKKDPGRVANEERTDSEQSLLAPNLTNLTSNNKGRCTREECREYLAMSAIPPDIADQVFDRMEASGWNWGQRPMIDWQASARVIATQVRADAHKSAGRNGSGTRKPFLSELQAKVKALEAQIAKHPMHPDSLQHTDHPTAQQRAEFAALRDLLAKAREQVAFG